MRHAFGRYDPIIDTQRVKSAASLRSFDFFDVKQKRPTFDIIIAKSADSCLPSRLKCALVRVCIFPRVASAIAMAVLSHDDLLNWLKEINVAKYIFVGYSLAKAVLWSQQSAYNFFLSAIFSEQLFMADVLCLGELLVDWVCTTLGAELDRAQIFTKAAGGAPANTAVGLARQGLSVGFIGRCSDDQFGMWLRSVLETDNIDTSGMKSDPDAQTRMAYVVTTMTGDRKLAEFSRVACADARLEPGDLKPEQFAKASVLHFGSISLIASPAAEATKKAVELAQSNKLLISYDPNVRLGLWPSPEACKSKILETLKWADMIKINEDELNFLTGSRHFSAAEELRK
ncbi:hypothetical protein BH10CYA1_BH10CYA1_44950 [soil metagenome]